MPLTPANYRRMRQIAGMSQTQVASLTGYSRPHVNRVEHGNAAPSSAYEDCFLAVVEAPHDELPAIPLSRAIRVLVELVPQLEVTIDSLERNRALLGRTRGTLGVLAQCLQAIGSKESNSDVGAKPFDPETATEDEIQAAIKAVESAALERCLDFNLHLVSRKEFRRWFRNIGESLDESIGSERNAIQVAGESGSSASERRDN